MKNSQHRNSTSRKPALSSIGLAVLATLIAGGAHAADTSYNFDGTLANASGHQTQNLPLSNTGAVRATLQNGAGNIDANGSQTANSTYLTGNTMGASAIGNLAKPVNTSIDLSLISDTLGGNQGLASLLHSTNSGVISSLVENNSLSITLQGFETGSAVNKDNTISASTVVNQGVSSITGTVPNGYTSATPGRTSVSAFMGPAESTAQGSIVVTTAQQASDATSSATAAGNEVTLALTAGTLAAVESGAALTGNRIVVSMQGNSSAGTIDIKAGGTPAFAGSAVVSNTQIGLNASALAVNTDATVRATVSGVNGVSQLGGSLAVSGNSIGSAATGNEALGSGLAPVGNRILLADGLAFAGVGGATPGATLNGYADGTAVGADLLIANTQSNQGTVGGTTVVSSSTSNGAIRATVDSLVNGAVNLSANNITSSATGNAASNALASGAGAASFDGSIALASQQDNSNVGISATNTGSAIVATVGVVGDNRAFAGEVQDSSVSVAGNRSSASARGNEVGQSLSLDATTLVLGTIADLNSQSNLLQASGAATVSSRQLNTGAPVSADNTNSSIGQRARAVTGPTLLVNGNTQEAVALANNASNQLTLIGTTVGSGAGILSLQRVAPEDIDPNSQVNATLSGARAFLEAGSVANGVTGSTLALTNNLQEAIGYGNLANNAMAVTGTTLAAPSTLGAASTVTFDNNLEKALGGNVVAAYGVLNDQSVRSDVSARATLTAGASADIVVTGALGNSAVLNNGNTLAAEAYGNFGQSSLTLNATNLNGAGYSSVANLTNLQEVDAAITAQAATGAAALTTINGAVGSNAAVASVSASGNRIDAQASGSRIANVLNVNATNIATVAAASTGASFGNAFIGNGLELAANASFSLQNAQSGQGGVTATLRDEDNVLPSDVRIAISGDVTRSAVVADGNTARASATSNNASNALAIDALGSLASSSALQNAQFTRAGVNTLIGQAGTAGTPAVAAGTYTTGAAATAVPTGDVAYNSQTGSFTVASGKTVTFSTAGAGSDKAALENYLSSLGFTVDSGAGTASVTGTTVNLSSLNNVNQGVSNGNSTYSFSGFTTSGVLATDGTSNLGGVNLAVGGAVTHSALSVSGNTTYGLARGNAASNLTSVKGNAIAAGSNVSVASATDGTFGLETVADHALSNVQAVTGINAINSNVYGSFFINAQPGAAITRSSLSVSGNTQMAEARANIAGNSLTLEGTGLTAVSALQSAQSSSAAVNASSNLNLFAPGAVSDSSVLLSNNSNIALAVINDATNSLTAKGSQVGTGQAGNSSVGGLFGDTLSAEQLLANQQMATTNVSSTASTSLNNQEAFASGTGSAIRSTLSILGNTTAAEATANQAFNTATADGTASQAASVALRNIQDSTANVTASATSAARIALAPLAQQTALNSSSVLLDGNSTTALARGNTASNVLNSLAGSTYGAALEGSIASGGGTMAVSANAGILNRQNNTGAVLASSTGASYQIALNSGGTAAAGSSLGVIGNQVAAQAYGNSAVNQLTLNALNTGTPTAAVGSYQSNSGAVSATVTSVAFGASITGAMTGSSVRANGNQITATAVGNSVVSSILAAVR